MAELHIKNVPTGTMNLDDDLHMIRNGDYGKAVGIRHISQDGEGSVTVEDVLGNRSSFQLPVISGAQSKKYRVIIDSSVSGTYGYRFYDNKKNLLITTGSYANTVGDINQSLSDISSAVTLYLTSLGYTSISSTTLTGLNSGVIDFTFNSGTRGYEWSMEGNTVDSGVPTILQEAYDITMGGKLEAIGGAYLDGALFLFSTNRSNLPIVRENNINLIQNNGAGLIRISTITAHGLVTGQSVYIYNAQAASNANGTWIVTVVSPTTFDLEFSTFSIISTTGGSIIINSESVSELGVAIKNEDADLWSYTTLFRTKQWSFRKVKQIDCEVQFENNRYSLYWVDDNNPDRVFYYDGDLQISFGGFRLLNPAGLYDYETVYSETLQEVNTVDIDFEIPEVIPSGGSLKSGNTRYVYKMITESGSETGWSELSNPLNIYKDPAILIPANEYQGNDDATVTSKSVRLTFNNIPTGLYKYIQIAFVRYTANVYEGFIIGKYLISDTSIVILHTGFETTYEDLDTATLNTLQSGYISSKNIRLVDQRLLKSNLTSSIVEDLTPFFKSWTHELFKEEVDSIPMPTTTPDSNLNDGEYFNEQLTYSKVGYLFNETYRFEARVQLFNGTWIDTSFFIDNVCFDMNANNTGNGTDNRRTGTFVDYGLFNSFTNKIYIPAIRFSFDPGFVINGVAIKDLIRKIMITRVEMTSQYQEILASGYIMPMVSGIFSTDPNGATAPQHDPALPIATQADNGIGFYEYMRYQMAEQTAVPNTYETATVASPQWGTLANPAKRNSYAAFYAPDIFLGKKEIIHSIGDKLLQFDNQSEVYLTSVGTYGVSGGCAMKSYYAALYCLNGTVTREIAIDEFKVVPKGGSATFANGDVVKKRIGVFWSNTNSEPFSFNYFERYNLPESPVLNSHTDTFRDATSDVVGTGWIYAQYFRDKRKGQKFGLSGNSYTIPTGASIKLDTNSVGILSVDVFGGDAFTQRTYLKYRYPEEKFTSFYRANSGCNLGPHANYFCVNGWGKGIAFYSQNRINSQMRYNPTPLAINMWPNATGNTTEWLERAALDPDTYQHGYDPRCEINAYPEFNVNARQIYKFITRFIYSEMMAIGSLVDNLRTFLPGNIYDLPIKDGPIVHHEICNGNVIAFQHNNFVQLYFNSNTLIPNSDGIDIILGAGQVIGNNVKNLSSFGSRHKWGILKGKSDTGKDVIYWINAENGRAFRFGGDGTSNITIIKKVRTYLRKALKWVVNKDTPADGQGISCIWDSRNYEAIFTVRAIREPSLAINAQYSIWENWFNAGSFAGISAGKVVMLDDYSGVTLSTFEQTPDLYECILGHIPNVDNRPGTGIDRDLYWKLIPHDDLNYYNEFTIAFSEVKNGWTCFYPFKPKIYLPYRDTYVSPRPVENVHKFYEHNEGELLTWYTDTTSTTSLDEQAIDGEIEIPINAEENMNKGFEALMINCITNPYKIFFRTNTQVSYLVSSDFEDRKTQFASTIKNDSTITVANPNGLNNQDTSPLYGTWIMTKFIFQNRVYQRLVDIVMKARIRHRHYKS